MALYRVLRPLTTGHQPGDLVDGNTFRALGALVKVGALIVAKSPPLAELPGWTTRAEKLATVGIVTIQDLLDVDPQKVIELFNHKRGTTLAKWQTEAKGWLRIEHKSN